MERQARAVPTLPIPWAFTGVMLAASTASATTLQAAVPAAATSYVDLSLDELLKVDVTSVVGRPEPCIAAPAALAAIAGVGGRRAGHRSITDALRMVPGIFVARINALSYVIGTCGLRGSALTSIRYLVMVDGRAVHDPVISTALWDVVDVPIRDIDCIEVIRGPGATLWGANATHGVINVVTLEADSTQGTILSASAGNLQSVAMLRHGVTSRKTALRAYVKYPRHADLDYAYGRSAHDSYAAMRADVRVADGAYGERTTWTLDAAAYDHRDASAIATVPVPGTHLQVTGGRSFADVGGAAVLLRARHGGSEQTSSSSDASLGRSKRITSRPVIWRDTVNLDLRHWLSSGGSQRADGRRAVHAARRSPYGWHRRVVPA